MSNVLILSGKPILKKEEEEALAKDNVWVTALLNNSEDIWKNIHGDFDYILLGNALGGTNIYQVNRVGTVKERG
jgi:hypothetical protein